MGVKALETGARARSQMARAGARNVCRR